MGFPVAEKYARPHAPEFASGKAYCPFKLDIWQLDHSLSDFKVWQCIFLLYYCLCLLAFSTIPSIDEVVVSMTDIDPVNRLNAKEAKDRLGAVIYSMALESLLIKPDNAEHDLP